MSSLQTVAGRRAPLSTPHSRAFSLLVFARGESEVRLFSAEKPRRLHNGHTSARLLRKLTDVARQTWGPDYSEVVGSMIARTCEIRLAGKPPISACLRTVASSGAM